MKNNTVGTVPTNNEAIDLVAQDAAAFALYKHETPESIATSWETVGLPIVLAYREKANVILSQFLAARRLSVSGDNAELIAEARDWAKYDTTGARVIVDALVDALEASQPCEVEVSDELRERIADEVGYPTTPDDVDESNSDEFARGRSEGYNAAFENVFAALGGGDHAE